MNPRKPHSFRTPALAGLVLAVALSNGIARAETTSDRASASEIQVLDVVGKRPTADAPTSGPSFAAQGDAPDSLQRQEGSDGLDCARWALGRVTAWWHAMLEGVRGIWLRASASLFGGHD